MGKYRVDIQAELNNIKVTPYGKTMRPNLHDSLEKLARKQNALSDTFDNLIIDAGNSNAEVVDARNDTASNPNVNHVTLGDRLNFMQTTINNHLAIPHVTYREVTPITTIDVLASDNNEAILTDDDQVILPTGITRNSENTRDTVISGVKIPDLPTVTPNDDDLVLLESKNGTASTKVSELLDPVNVEINTLKQGSMKYTQI